MSQTPNVNQHTTCDLAEAMYLIRWRYKAPKLMKVEIVEGAGIENRFRMTFEGTGVFMDHYDYERGKCGHLEANPTHLARLFKEILSFVRAQKKAAAEVIAQGGQL